MKDNKVKAGFSLESQTIERLEKLVQITRLSKSAIVDSAIEDWYKKKTLQDKSAMCPFDCGTVLIAHPDPLMVHTFYCPTCEKSVVFAPEVTG